MSTPRGGFSLLEALVAVSLLALSVVVALRFTVATTHGVAVGRRWTAMAEAVESEVVRLERDFRAGRPGCVPPAPGSRLTADAVALDWAVAGDSVLIQLVVTARAAAAGRTLADSVATSVSCR
ncbi:MAG: prepilin-type N-terminal cleavage/methylation domain-containing protein [Gemmatimonadales bacterium]|nr:prepilin-type N-terminal cleavage/methylation domain-containing protein [Gemmatimonadales bacterium]